MRHVVEDCGAYRARSVTTSRSKLASGIGWNQIRSGRARMKWVKKARVTPMVALLS